MTTTEVTNTEEKQVKCRENERGNVLFLILIAVALFAALSYAVTQSTRSGSNDASSETNLINSAQLAQYPAGVRTAVVRMIIGGVPVDQLLFDTPSDFGLVEAPTDLSATAVFHPNGGGAVFQSAPNEVMADHLPASWIFTSDYEVTQIGQSIAASPDGNEIMAMLPNVSSSVCKKINKELGITGTDADSDGVPTAGTAILPVYATNSMTGFNPTNTGIGNETATIAGAFVGQPFGCFDADDSDDDSKYVYYHVIVER
jgi:hypothetical protein